MDDAGLGTRESGKFSKASLYRISIPCTVVDATNWRYPMGSDSQDPREAMDFPGLNTAFVS
jgi:hypothetical protein